MLFISSFTKPKCFFFASSFSFLNSMIKEFSKKCLKKWLFLFCSDMLYNHLKTEFITKKKKKTVTIKSRKKKGEKDKKTLQKNGKL